MSSGNEDFDSVEDAKEEESEEVELEAKKEPARDDPFASLNMPPPVGFESEEEESEEDIDLSVSALDVRSRDKKKKNSNLSQKSENFLASIGVGVDDDSEEEKVQLSAVEMPRINQNNLFGEFGDDETGTLNDPMTTQLEEPPLLGGRISSTSGMRGAVGRATSPRLFAGASQFPTCTQLKCIQWENGTPVSIGAIDAMADESDFIREFFENMPKKNEGKMRFSFRPVDMNGQELGSEVAFYISENHKEILRRRKMNNEDSSEDESEEVFTGMFNRRNRAPARHRSSGGSGFAGDADRVWKKMVSDTQSQTDTLRSTLEEERDRLRRIEGERSQERVDFAVTTAQGVQAMSDKMLAADQQRSQLSLQQQQQQTDVMMNSLSQIFSQQQNMTQLQMTKQQQADQMRVEQERQRSERERLDLEERRRRDREDYEERRSREQRDADQKWKEQERKWEREMESNRLRLSEEKMENERKIAREREELMLKLKMDREEADRKENRLREERKISEDRRKEEFELRQKQLEIQSQRDKEHQERMMQMAIAERDAQRDALERKSVLEREARDSQDKERHRRHEMMMKELDQTRQRDREHSERMFTLKQKEVDAKGLNSLDSLVPKLGGFLTQFGLEPVDVLRSILGQGEVGEDIEDSGGASSWMENLPKILGSVGDVAKLFSGGMGQAMVPQQPMLVQDPNLQNLMHQQQMVREQMKQQAGAKAAPNFDQFYPPPSRAEQPTNPYAGNKATVEGKEYKLDIPDSTVKKEPTTSQLASNEGMELSDQRNARKALRAVIKKLRSAKEDKWEGIVTSALVAEIGIFTYIVAVTAKTAFIEAGADSELSSKIIKSLKESDVLKTTLASFGMNINNIPFGE